MANSNSQPPITFKTNPNERRRIVADAKAAGMSLSTYIRFRLLEAPETKAVYRRSQTRRLMTHLIGHMGRVGNNMNQIAFKLNSDAILLTLDRNLHEEGVTALKEMRTLLISHLLQNGPC